MFKSKQSLFLIGLVASFIFTLGLHTFVCFITEPEIAQASSTQDTSYRWQNVAIGGGGFVTGIVIHPTEPNLIYIRTDVGGAYRWDEKNQTWIPLMEMFGFNEKNLFGIESLVIDPTNPNLVYAATGEYTDSRGTNGVVLKSTDRGKSWSQINLTFKLGANEEGRWNGERLAVDPNQTNVLYLGSRNDGLWRSTDSAVTWRKVSNFPTNGTKNRGISFIIFDPQTVTPANLTQTIYVGVVGSGVYRSQDGGNNWNLLSTDSAVNPQKAALATDGTLYVAYDSPGSIQKFQNNQWTDITPANLNFNAISVDPKNPDNLVAAEFFFNAFNKLFRTTDGGQSWQEIQYKKDSSVPWWPDRNWASGVSSLVFDPSDSKRVWYTDGWGIWRTDDIDASPSVWRNYVTGHEEIVNFTLKSQPGSGALLQGSADIGGLRHDDLTRFPDSLIQSPSWIVSEIVSIDSAETNPNFVVSVGGRRWKSEGYPDPGYGAYSTDDGKTWTEFSSYPQGFRKTQNGRVAVSATNDNHIVWAPQGESNVPYYSNDRGKTWNPSQGAPSGTTLSVWQWNQPLTSDKVNGNKFYLYKDGQFYRSTDGGATWSITVNNLPNLNMDWDKATWSSVKAVPSLEGEVWVSFNTMGLFRSSDSGSSFTQVKDVQQAYLFAFGKNPTNQANPTVFVYGKVNNTAGIFQSDDLGQNWVKIDVPTQRIGKDPKFMEGDRQIYGRVYVGTGGRGIYYSEPANTPVTIKKQDSFSNSILKWLVPLRFCSK